MPEINSDKDFEKSLDDSKRSVGTGIEVGKKGVEAAKKGVKAGKKIASTVSSKGLKNAILELLFGGLNPAIVAGFLGILLAVIIFAVVIGTNNSSTFFTSEATPIDKIEYSLTPGFVDTKKRAKSFVKDYVNSKYGCKASDGDIQFVDNEKFVISTDYCELTVDFEPDLEEFAQRIDSYANAVNSTIQFFNGDESSIQITENENTNFQSNLSYLDDNGQIRLTDYGQSVLNEYDSEYVSNQSSSYFNTLKKYSYQMFTTSTDESQFINKTYRGTKTLKATRCYVNTSKKSSLGEIIKTRTQVSCSSYHDEEEEYTYTVQAQFGNITIPMDYDPKIYKASEIEGVKNSLINQEAYLPKDDDGNEYEYRTIKDYNEASYLVDGVLSDYEFSYMSLYFLYGDIGYGFSGFITSNGWDYSKQVSSSDLMVAQAFWAYSRTLNAQLHNLPYRTDYNGGGPAMTSQCTQFAATFFYDVYGFAALRGNGNMQAEYLVKDCDSDSSCPVKFARSSTPAPGSIVSLYPNHVIVVNQVDDDGTVYISEGNIGGGGRIRTNVKYSSLQAYAQDMGMTIKTIAVPVRD